MLTFNHFNFNVSNLDASLKFYAEALDLREVRRKEAEDGSFTIVFLGDGQTDFRLELTALRDHLKATPYGDRVRFDFSIMNDMSYYNGVVFCGYLDGICECVLSGGQYNKLMKRMGRKAGAIGFALYLDLLEGLTGNTPAYDVDVLVLYDALTPTASVTATVSALRAEGKTVSAQRAIPEKLRYATLCDLRKEGTR